MCHLIVEPVGSMNSRLRVLGGGITYLGGGGVNLMHFFNFLGGFGCFSGGIWDSGRGKPICDICINVDLCMFFHCKIIATSS